MKRPSRHERMIANNQRRMDSLAGTGIYIFKNSSTKADYMLSKPSMEGWKNIGPGQEFKGDSYFLQFVGQGLARVATIQENNTMLTEEKLILDQPDKVTPKGKVEQVIEKKQKLNEIAPVVTTTEDEVSTEKLLTDDPFSGVEIVE